MDEILRRLLAAVGEDASVASLVDEARDQAKAEVRTLLKSAFKASMLRQAIERLEGAPATPPRIAEPASRDGRSACYVYAITPAGDSAPPREFGVDPAFPLESVACDDVQAIVSEVSLDEFGQAALNDHAADPQWIEAKVRAHDRVVKSARSFGAVIPCRFCTVVRNRDDVRKLLRENHQRVASTLDQLKGKSEWGVKLYFGGSDRASDNAAPSGKGYLQQKQQARDERRQSHGEAADFHQELTGAAERAVELPIQTNGDGEQLLNAAYLVADARVEEFRARVEAWAGHHATAGWRAEITGPWPPYNFAHLDLTVEAPA